MDKQPPTSARLTRRVLLAAVGAVAISTVAASVVMNTPVGPSVAIPGPLSAQHATLEQRCEHCHSADMGAVKGPLHGVFGSELALRDSERCLDCHDLGDHAMHAHAVSSGTLEAATARLASDERARVPRGLSLPPNAHGELACSVCHVEHEGRMNDLTSITDAQCQTCHTVRFDGFHDGHPEFDGYPYERRLRIAFDHASHIQRHFNAGSSEWTPGACTDCHSPDASGASMRTAPFEQACASCHEQDVRALGRSAGAGAPFFALPAIDTYALDDAGIGIGQWPADSGVAEGRITPFMRVMLGVDPSVRADLRTLDGLDLLDLTDATEDELRAVARVAWAIKGLAMEIAEGGHDAIVRRVSDAAGDDRVFAEGGTLAGGLPRSVFRRCVDAWLPGLEAELRERSGGGSLPTDLLEGESFDEIDGAGERWASMGGWYRDDLSFALRYRPAGHADPLLRAWIDLAAGHPSVGEPVLRALGASDAVGQCLKCHSVDSVGGEVKALRVNWWAHQPSDSGGGLTRFSHKPHLALLDDQGCRACHTVESTSTTFGLAFEQRDPAMFERALGMMSRAQCADCHQPSKTTSSCVSCHDYHAHRPAMRLRSGASLAP